MSRRRNLLLKINGNGNRLPRTGLLRAGSMVDTIGTSARPNQLRQYGTFLNGETLTSASIVGTETVISSEGTCTPVVSAGTITFDAGTCWNIVLSNGSTYSHPTKTGAAAGIWFDRSGAGIHLTVNVADIDAHVTEEIDQGSNTLELQGWTEGEPDVVELWVNPTTQTIDEDNYSTYDTETGIGRIVSDGTGIGLSIPNILVVGRSYKIIFTELINITGSVKLSYPEIFFNSGSEIVNVIASNVNLLMFRGNPGVPCDITFQLSVQELPQGKIPLLSDLSASCLGQTPTYTGRVKYSLSPKNAPCATFDGVGDSILTSITTQTNSEYAWSFIAPASGSTHFIIGGVSGSLQVRLNSSNAIEIVENGVAIRGTFSEVFIEGSEYNIRTVINNSNAYLYIDDALIDSLSYTADFDVTGVISIGKSMTGTAYYFVGKMWGVVINGIHFPLSESAGTIVYGYDSEGNNYTGTVTASDIGAFWGSTQDSFFHDWEYGWELSGSVRIPGNPYTGLSCAGNTLTTQPYQLTANDWSFPATGDLRDADDNILADTGSRFIYDTDGATPLDWSVDDITGGFINDQLFYGKNKISMYDDAQIDPALTKIKKYHGIS